MALKFNVDSLEGLDESVQSLYKEGEDGKYTLDVEGVKPATEFSKVYDLLQTERNTRKDIETKLKGYGDVTPDSIEEMREKLQELELQTGELDDTKINELVEHKMKPLTRRQEKIQAERDEALNQLNTLREEIRAEKRDNNLVEAAREKVKPEFYTDLKLRANNDLEFNEQLNEWVSKDGLSIDEWVSAQLTTTPSWAPVSNGAGASGGAAAATPAGKNPFNKETWNLTEQAKLYKDNRKMYDRLKAQAGS